MINYNIIVAFDIKRGIGKDNKLPWYIPEDLKYFSKLTRGNRKNAVIMGKNTWNSLPMKLLKGRDNLILSRTLNIEENNPKNDYIKSFNSIDELEIFCKNQEYEKVWIIGGSEIYNLFINDNKITNIYVTLIHKKYDCDCFFPILDKWKVISKEDKIVNNINISYCIYEKLLS
tara:strand:- start:145 stop:663 length:519 start_codon:yes stop_codon:yes gene_type:complete